MHWVKKRADLHQMGKYHNENNRCYKPLFIKLLPVSLNTHIYGQGLWLYLLYNTHKTQQAFQEASLWNRNMHTSRHRWYCRNSDCFCCLVNIYQSFENMVSFSSYNRLLNWRQLHVTSAPMHQHKVVTSCLYEVQVLILHCSWLLWPLQAQQLLHRSAVCIKVFKAVFFLRDN